jgi:gamma-glutamylcyclotransferase (GGCT)/AIG2-like uncharacterized protein YtfP
MGCRLAFYHPPNSQGEGSTAMTKRIFFYGTLKSGHGRIDELTCAGKLLFIGRGRIKGRLYNGEHYPAAVREEGGYVHGEVYEIVDFAILPGLDAYEEYDPHSPEKSLFVRAVSKVRLRSGRDTLAFVYFYNRATDKLKLIPTGRWSPLEIMKD